MLSILGSSKRLCDGLTRRDLMHVGGLGTLGLGPWGPIALGADTKPLGESSRLGGFGQAKRCILLSLWGSPSQLDTWDPKPEAPVEIRGDIRSINTAMPGVRISEIFPRTAAILNKVCVLYRRTKVSFRVQSADAGKQQ